MRPRQQEVSRASKGLQSPNKRTGTQLASPLGHVAGKNINVQERAHQDRLERRDLHDEERAEVRAVRLSMYFAVRRCDRIKRDRHEESGAVDLSALKQARLHREQIAAPLHQTIIPREIQSFDLSPDKGHELVFRASTNEKTTVKRWDTNVMALKN